MTVKTLIEKLSHYNKDAIVRLHHREGGQIQQNITQEDPLRPIRTMIPLLLSITNFWRR